MALLLLTLKDYQERHPEVTVLDPPDAIQHLHNRQSMLHDVADMNLSDALGNSHEHFSFVRVLVCLLYVLISSYVQLKVICVVGYALSDMLICEQLKVICLKDCYTECIYL
jgi:hypothetical protein